MKTSIIGAGNVDGALYFPDVDAGPLDRSRLPKDGAIKWINEAHEQRLGTNIDLKLPRE